MTENRAGLVTGIIAGAGALVLIVVISFFVIQTLNDADLLRNTRPIVVDNESGTAGWGMLNSSDVADGVPPLDSFNINNRDYAIITVWNVSVPSVPLSIASTSWTFNRTGSLINSTATVFNMTNVTYQYYPRTTYEGAFDELSGNYTSGIRNVSAKIPTVLLVSAMVLLLGILMLLVVRARNMQLESTGGSGIKGGTGFGGGSSGSSVDGSTSGSL